MEEESSVGGVKLVSSDMALSRLEESVVQDIELERRMATLRSTNSRGEAEPSMPCQILNNVKQS